MPEPTWCSTAEAARKLNLSERTVWRRIGAGGLQSRLTADGRREVLLTPDASSDTASEAVSALDHQAERNLQLAGAAVGQARELALHLQADLRAARRGARIAWSLAAALVIAAAVAAWWTTRTVTVKEARADLAEALLAETRARAQAEVLDLTGRLAEKAADQARLTERLDRTQDRLNQTLLDLAEARADQACLQADLAAERASRAPSTMPADEEADVGG